MTPGRARAALLVALGIDNFGSGLFLPLTLVFVTQVVGLPLAVAGTAVTIGTVAGLVAPPLAGRLTDRVGARAVVVAAQLLQAGGALAYLLARGAVPVVGAAILLGAGQQTFYSALFALIGEVAGAGPKDRAFTVAAMVRGASFGLGALVAAALLAGVGPLGYQLAVGVDAVSFLLAAPLLVGLPRPASMPRSGRTGSVLGDRPFLALIAITFLFALSLDFFLVGVPVYALDILHTPGWLPGVLLAVLTMAGSTAGTWALRRTAGLSRIGALMVAAVLNLGWCVLSAAALLASPGWRVAVLVASTLLIAAANLVASGRINALAEAAAAPPARGRYLAAFQYAFTLAGVLTPSIVSSFAVAPWLPWLIVAAAGCAAAVGLRMLSPHLPAHAVVAAR